MANIVKQFMGLLLKVMPIPEKQISTPLVRRTKNHVIRRIYDRKTCARSSDRHFCCKMSLIFLIQRNRNQIKNTREKLWLTKRYLKVWFMMSMKIY